MRPQRLPGAVQRLKVLLAQRVEMEAGDALKVGVSQLIDREAQPRMRGARVIARNLALGVHLTPVAPGWRAMVSLLGSLLALASPVVLCFAFFVEAPVASPERVWTLVGVIAVTAGITLHVLGGARR